MKTFLVCMVGLCAVVAGAWFGFPLWYLNTSPRVLIAPRSLLHVEHGPNEQEGRSQKPDGPSPHPVSSSDPTQLMYLDQAHEVRMAAGFKQMQLPLPILRIGIGTDENYQVAAIEFYVGDRPEPPAIERQTLEIAYTAYRMVPTLEEIDVYGVDRPDLRDKRGNELYSITIRRDAFQAANPRLPRHAQVAQLGTPWYKLEQEPPDKR